MAAEGFPLMYPFVFLGPAHEGPDVMLHEGCLCLIRSQHHPQFYSPTHHAIYLVTLLLFFTYLLSSHGSRPGK